MTKKKTLLVISIYYSLVFMANACYLSYISLYYSDIGFDNQQIGAISAAMAAIGLVAQPLLGTVSDRASYKNPVLKMVLLFSALTTWLIPLAGKHFWAVFAAVAVFSIFNNTVNPLSDTIALELSDKEGFKFSKVRLVGSVGYALMAVIAGKIFSVNIWYIFPAFFLYRFVAFLIAFFIPPVEGYRDSTRPVGFFELFKDRKLVLLYIYVFILSSTMGFFQSFHAIYSKEVGIGTGILGIGIMIGSVSQFPFMALFDRLHQKFGLINILLFSGLMYGLRWLLYAYALTPASIIALWAMHGMNFVLAYLCLTEYVSVNVAPELRTRGQMMNTIVLMGVSSIVGGYLGGILSSWLGLGRVFTVCAVLCFAAVLLFVFTARKFDFKSKCDTEAAA